MARYKVELEDMVVEIDEDLKYTKTDEWVRVEGDKAVVGVTDYAQKMLKDIVGVDLPEVGAKVSMGEAVATLESVKATADVYAPLSGEVIEVNERLLDEPELINKDPYGEGWIFAIKPSNLEELNKLLDHKAYVEKLKTEKH
jgi:glycine cleavage system H protein